MTESYPLKWPIGREHTPSYSRKPAAFKTTMGKARDELLRQLKMMGARDVIISSNVETYTRAGQQIMYADQSAAKENPGVAVYYTWNKDQYALACDKWNAVADNLQALMKTVDAIRGIARWGTGEMVKAAFAGFKELPQSAENSPWWEVLGVSKTANITEIKESYRKLAMQHHPDKGGNREIFQGIAEAYNKGISANS